MWRHFMLTLSVVAMALLAGAGVAGAASYYTATELGVLYGSASESAVPNAINNAGQIAGTSKYESGGAVHAFRWDNGTMTDLGDMAQNPSYKGSSWGTGITAGGTVVGHTNIYSVPYIHLVTWDTGGNKIDLNYTASGLGGSKYVYGNGVSPNGAYIANTYSTDTAGMGTPGAPYAAVVAGSAENILGGQGTFAYAANDNGTVVGWAAGHAQLWYNNSGAWTNVTLTSQGPNSSAKAINASGTIVGSFNSYSGGISADRATKWVGAGPANGGTVVDLGTLVPSVPNATSYATGINAGGMIVGYSWADGSGTVNHAFVDNGTTMWDLTAIASGVTAGYTLTQANAINDNGWIVAQGTNGSKTHAFLLKPAFAGDANGDLKVDVIDLGKALTNYNKSGTTWADGDFDGNGTVNIDDLTKVLTNYDKGAASSAAGVNAVPEPSTMVVLFVSVAAGLLFSLRRYRR